MLNFIRQYWEKFCHAYAWAKFGWNDNSYDYTKIFDALVFKLKMHQKAMAEHHLHETSHEDAQDMGRAAELINSSIDETHQLEAHKYIEEKYGALNFIFTDDKPYPKLILKREKIETEAEESVCNIEEVMYGVDKEANNNNGNTSTPSVQKKQQKRKMV